MRLNLSYFHSQISHHVQRVGQNDVNCSSSGKLGDYGCSFDGEGDYVIPFIESFEDGKVLISHSYVVEETTLPNSAVFYNSTFVLLTEDFTLREMPVLLGTGKVVYGSGTEKDYGNLTIPTHNPGILVVTYNTNKGKGVVLMPWGISSLAFSVTFGGDPSKQEWVATDMRQVTVGGIAYQAQISAWSLEGYQVVG